MYLVIMGLGTSGLSSVYMWSVSQQWWDRDVNSSSKTDFFQKFQDVTFGFVCDYFYSFIYLFSFAGGNHRLHSKVMQKSH